MIQPSEDTRKRMDLERAIISFRRIGKTRREYENAMRENARLVMRLDREQFKAYAIQTQIIDETEG